MSSAADATTFSDYPKKLTVALTDRCNLKCFICVREEFELDGNGRGQHMPLENLYKLENPIRHAQVIQLSGFGESFLYPHLDEALDFIYAVNERPDLIYMISNGTQLTRKWGERLDGRLNYLAISLNAANPEEYRRDMLPYLYRYTRDTAPEAYRGKQFAEDNERERPCEFTRTLDRIRDFMAGLGEHSRANVGLHYVVHSQNVMHMSAFVELAHQLGISKVEFNPYLVNRVENIDYSIFFHKEAFNAELDRAQALAARYGIRALGRKFGSESRRPFNRGRDCHWPTDESLVFTGGAVGACCFAGNNMIGNAFNGETDFDDIWFGTAYQRLRKERWFDACQRCNLFHTIDDWQTHFHPKVKTNARYQEVVGHFEDEETRQTTRVVVVGAGRDGTRSLARLLENLHMANGEQVRMLHEGESFRTADGVIRYLRDDRPERLTACFDDWRQEIVAGNVFAFALPLLRKSFGRGLKVIHLVREREACIRSLLAEARREPLYWTGFVEAPQVLHDETEAVAALAALQPVRPTAVLTGAMTAVQWLALEPEARLGWYYDAAHAAIEQGLREFTQTETVRTEALNEPETARRLAGFLHPGWRGEVAPVHVNSTAYRLSGAFDPALEALAQEVFQDFDLWQVRASETYAVIHFLQRWLDRHGSAPGPGMIGELASIREAIDTLVAEADAGLVPAVDQDLVEGILRDLPEGALGLDEARRREVVLRFAGMDWREAAGNPVYPVLFSLRRLAELRCADATAGGELNDLLHFLVQQIEALQQKLLGSRAAQAAA